jgi:hypothetical protein
MISFAGRNSLRPAELCPFTSYHILDFGLEHDSAVLDQSSVLHRMLFHPIVKEKVNPIVTRESGGMH